MATRANPAVAAAPQIPDIQTQKPFVAFQPGDVPPSQAIYLQLNDAIFIKVMTNANFPSAVARYRYLTPQGDIKEGTLPLNIQPIITVFQLPLGEAWLLSILLDSNNSGSANSWFFAQIGIARGLFAGGAFPQQGFLWEGYVVNGEANGWPGGSNKQIWDGPGTLRSIVGTGPGAGAEMQEVVPAFRRWQLLSLRIGLTTSAAVANRSPHFIIDDGVNIYHASPNNTPQAASVVGFYDLCPGAQYQNDGLGFIMETGPAQIILKAGHRIKTFTTNLQGADQYSAPFYTVLEWGEWDT